MHGPHAGAVLLQLCKCSPLSSADQSPLQILNAVASGADTGSMVAAVCRNILGRTSPAQSRRLAYDIVACGGLADSEWDDVTRGMQGDLASSVAVEACPALMVQLSLA